MEKDNIGNWYMFSSRRNVKILWSEEKIEDQNGVIHFGHFNLHLQLPVFCDQGCIIENFLYNKSVK